MKLFTTEADRKIVMEQLRTVSHFEKMVFPVVTTIFISLLLPPVCSLIGMLMLGNLFTEAGCLGRLSDTAQNALMVGTPPNIIANGALQAAGIKDTFGFFEYAWIGIPLTVVGILYMMFIGKHLLPAAALDADQEIEQEIEAGDTSSKKQWISGAILLVVVIVMAVGDSIGLKGIVTLEMAAIVGAMISVLSGCLTEKQAYASIDWVTIFLFAGMTKGRQDKIPVALLHF